MDDRQPQPRSKALIWIPVFLAALAALVAVLVEVLHRRRLAQARTRRPVLPAIPEGIEGLSETEAEARREEGQDNSIDLKPSRTRQDIIRDNVYTIFNLNLVGIAVAQAILGRWLDVLISIGMIFVNIGLNVGQELIAQRRIRDISDATRARATVLREGRARSVDSSHVVLGDVILVGPGDGLPVDGRVVGESQFMVDESMLTGERRRTAKQAGDPVYAGSYCLGGRGALEAQKVGADRLIVERLKELHKARETLTPLERVIDRILRILLVLVITFTVLLFMSYFRFNPGIPEDVINDAASVVFSIAPSSLFFMILLTYAAGTADLAKIGALVHRARSIETLAQATVICFARAGILTGTHVEIKPFDAPDDGAGLAESRIRQILGDFARSVSVGNLGTQALIGSFEGNVRPVYEEAPFLSVYGWSAASFDDEDLRGTYVMGNREILAYNLAAGREQDGDRELESRLESVRQTVAPLGRFFRRTRSEARDREEWEHPVPGPTNGSSLSGVVAMATPRSASMHAEASGSAKASAPAAAAADAGGESQRKAGAGDEVPLDIGPAGTKDKPRGHGFLGRLRKRVGQVFEREDKKKEAMEAPDEEEPDETEMLFAYRPEIVPLYTNGATPQLPRELIPLCTLRYSEQVRKEAVDTIQTFTRTGVAIKIFSPDAAEHTAMLLNRAGIGRENGQPFGTINGPVFEALSTREQADATTQNTVFGHLSPEQAAQVVDRLRWQGKSVAVVGDGVSDVAALRQADLAIARRSSSQAALNTADIVLLEDSPQVLEGVLGKGQRIGNGLMDVLKLHLTQVFALALLIIGIRLVAYGFPYQSAQGGLINVAALSLPAAGLSLWAATGVLPRSHLGRLLALFFVPAAITMSLAGLFVYTHFLNETGKVPYAQLALTYTLVFAGLTLVLFVRPPVRLRWPPRVAFGDPRPALLALVVLVLFLVLPFVGLARELLKIDFLAGQEDYGFVGLVVLVWAITFGVVRFLVDLAHRVLHRLRRSQH